MYLEVKCSNHMHLRFSTSSCCFLPDRHVALRSFLSDTCGILPRTDRGYLVEVTSKGNRCFNFFRCSLAKLLWIFCVLICPFTSHHHLNSPIFSMPNSSKFILVKNGLFKLALLFREWSLSHFVHNFLY